MTEMIERLRAAAAAALEDLGPILEHEAPKLRSVMLALTLANGGWAAECTAWVERLARGRRS